MIENIVGDGGGAFPCEECMEAGMSLRDYFAAKALQALIAKAPMLYCQHGDVETAAKMRHFREAIAVGAYQYADTMLYEREIGVDSDE